MEEQTGIRPQALETEPELNDEQEDYLRAYSQLAPGRQLGFGSAGGIPMADIAAYAQLFQIENAGRFVDYIRTIDAEFLRIAHERSNSAS